MLRVQGLAKSFGGLAAVKQLTFMVSEGEILGLIGPNGSGKTTAFNLITGLISPDSGHIWLGSEDITGLRPHVICGKGIARTFQLVRPFMHLSGLHNVMVGRIYGHGPAAGRTEAASDARELLAFVGLAGREDTPARQLTLVDRRRLELARALATRPRLLLLDEFMAGLNPHEIEAAMGLIRRLRAAGCTVIMVEHIVKAVMGLSDRVVVLVAGEAIAEGPPAAVASNPRVVEAYLGSAPGA